MQPHSPPCNADWELAEQAPCDIRGARQHISAFRVPRPFWYIAHVGKVVRPCRVGKSEAPFKGSASGLQEVFDGLLQLVPEVLPESQTSYADENVRVGRSRLHRHSH